MSSYELDLVFLYLIRICKHIYLVVMRMVSLVLASLDLKLSCILKIQLDSGYTNYLVLTCENT